MFCPLSQGGFAKCYEMTDLSTSKVYAAKIIPHARVSKPHQREKVSARLRAHCSDHTELMCPVTRSPPVTTLTTVSCPLDI